MGRLLILTPMILMDILPALPYQDRRAQPQNTAIRILKGKTEESALNRSGRFCIPAI